MRLRLLTALLLAGCLPDKNPDDEVVEADADTDADSDADSDADPDADSDADSDADTDCDDPPAWYADADGDGYGDASASTLACDAPAGTVLDATDCDDTTAGTHPGADERRWTAADDDCDGMRRATLSAADADCTFVGEDAGDHAGEKIATADVDGDGISDVLISAPANTRGGPGAGAAYVFFGATLVCGADLDLSAADWIFYGEVAGDQVIGVTSPGDVDGDGRDELLVGADYHGAYLGRSYLIPGSSLAAAGGVASLATAPYKFDGVANTGYSIPAPAGDLDGDGRADLMFDSVAADEWAGRVYIWMATDLTSSGTRSLADAPYQLTGPAPYAVCGYDGNGNPRVGDLDGDGRDDLVVGCKGWETTDTGRAYVVLAADLARGTNALASTASHCVQGEAGERVGLTVAGAGDLDGDGSADLLVGGMNADGETGVVYALLAADLSGTACVAASDLAYGTFRGAAPDDRMGRDLDGVGDVDGDGLADLAVAAWANDTAAFGAGTAWVVFGSELAAGGYDLSDATLTFTGAAADDGLGKGLRGRGDFDGDGLGDLLVSAPYADAGGADAGAVYVFLGD